MDETNHGAIGDSLRKKLEKIKKHLKSFKRFSKSSLEAYLSSSLSLKPTELNALLVNKNSQNYAHICPLALPISPTPMPPLLPPSTPLNLLPIWCVVGATVRIAAGTGIQ